MEEHPQSLKRKRESDYPRVTFDTGTRTFDRLLKESTLEDLKYGVRKKLGYPRHVPLQLAQIRDGKTVDLEDEDDFEAFCSAAYTLSVITVQVSAPENVPRVTPAESTPVPPPALGSPEPHKKKKKKRKAEKDPETGEPAHGQKRKAPVSDVEDEVPKESHPLSPKKKKKNSSEVSQIRFLGPDDPASKEIAETATTAEEQSEEPTKQPKSKKKEKSKATSVVEDLDKVEDAPVEEDEAPQTKKRKKERRKKDGPGEQKGADPQTVEQNDPKNGQEGAPDDAPGSSKTPGEKTKGKAKAKESAPVDEPLTKKKVDGKVPPPNTNEKVALANGKETTTAPVEATEKAFPAKKPTVNERASGPQLKKTGKQPTGSSVKSTPHDDASEANGKIKSNAAKRSVVAPKGARAQIANEAEIRAQIDKIVAEKAEKKKLLATQAELSKSNASNPDPKSRKSREAVANPELALGTCQLCGISPSHTRSRCPMKRRAASTIRRKLGELKDVQTVQPSDFRAQQIKEIEIVLGEKEGKSTQSNGEKVVSDVVTDVIPETTNPNAQDNSKVPENAKIRRLPDDRLSPRTAPRNRIDAIATISSRAAPKPKGSSSPDTSSGEEHLTKHNGSKLNLSTSQPKDRLSEHRSKPGTSVTSNEDDDARPISILEGLKSYIQDRRPSTSSSNGAQDLASAINRATSFVAHSPNSPSLTAAVSKVPPAPNPTKMLKANPKQGLPTVDSSDDSSDEAARVAPLPPGPTTQLPLSCNDVDLDAVIRGPNISLTTKDLPSSDSSEDDGDDETDLLVEDEEEPRHLQLAKTKGAELLPDEEDSDGADQESNGISAAPQRPPRLSIHQTDESAPSTAVGHGNLTSGGVNELVSSVEIDPQGDRAFSEALADDAAVFNLAGGDEENSSHEGSGRGTPKNATVKAKVAAPNLRYRSIETFESPVKRVEIVDEAFDLGSTRNTKAIARKSNAQQSMDNAMKLLDSVQKAKATETSKGKATTKTASQSIPTSTPKDQAKAVEPPGQARSSKLQPPSSQASKKPTCRTVQTRSQKPVSQVLPPRTTRSTLRNQAQATQETQSEHVWQVLPDNSSQYTMNMEDELRSEPEEDEGNPLFIPSETQNPFPYSQWQGSRTPVRDSPHELQDEDEVESVITGKQTPSRKTGFGYTGLSHIASQRRSFRTSLVAAPSKAADKKKDMVAELYGQTGNDPSDESGSDSDSDSDADKSHIPKSRRAGIRSKA